MVFVLSVFLLSAGYFVWPGCATMPLPSKRVPISDVTTKQVKRIDHLGLTKDEVEREIGKPTEFYPDVQVACYSMNRLDRSRVVLFLFLIPIDWYPEKSGAEVAMIQYDGRGRMLRAVVRKQYPYSGTFRTSVQKWVSRHPGFKEPR